MLLYVSCCILLIDNNDLENYGEKTYSDMQVNIVDLETIKQSFQNKNAIENKDLAKGMARLLQL